MMNHAAVAPDERLGGQSRPERSIGQVRRDLRVVADGESPESPWTPARADIREQSQYVTSKRVEGNQRRIEADHQGAEGRDSFDNPFDRNVGNTIGERKD